MSQAWNARLRAFAPRFLEEHPALAPAAAEAAVLLHGSTTFGVDDPYSDLDVWLLVTEERARTIDAAAGTGFFVFTLEGKPGHFTVELASDFEERVRRCDFALITELRSAQILADPNGRAASLIAVARQPMPEEVRRAWFCYHYVEMRGEHRACDNPIDRGDAVAVLQAMTQTLSHALRAAMVVDGQPYPYVKWLGRAAFRTPTGRRLEPKVTELLDLLAQDALRAPGPEKHHPLTRALREIRSLLVDAAQESGLDAPWLHDWWLFMDQARRGMQEVRWS
jgi:Domain of unknown function (DUF4037)